MELRGQSTLVATPLFLCLGDSSSTTTHPGEFLIPQTSTWHRLGGAAGGAKAVIVDCDDPEVIAYAWLQDVHTEGVGAHFFRDVFDEDVPESLICKGTEGREQ